jgi:hypothetical protein
MRPGDPALGVVMLWFSGLISVIAGGVTAYIADRFPPYVELLQTIGGLLLIAGLGLFSANLPIMI